MTDTSTAVLERPPQLIRPDEVMANRLSQLQRERLQEQPRQPLSIDELSKLSGINKADTEALVVARQFEGVLTGMHRLKRMEEERKPDSKPSDPGGKRVGLKRVGDKLEFDKKFGQKWDVMGTIWNNTAVEQTHESMNNLFRGEYQLGNDQMQTALELLIAQGYTPEMLAERLTPEALQAVRAQLNAGDRTEADVSSRALLIFFTNNLRIREDYVRRFIMPDRFEELNDREFQLQPKNVEDLAWQISWKKEEKWGIRGDFPLLELREVDNLETGRKETKFFLNKANFRLWVRERAQELLDVSPFSTPNFDAEIKLDKGGFYDISLERFYHNRDSYLKSESKWISCEEDLVRDLQIDSVLMTFSRQAWVAFDKSKRDMKEMMKVITTIHEMNLISRKSFGTDLISMLTRMPLRDQGVAKEGEAVINDNIMGSAWLDMLLAYEAISDFPRLEEVLGKHSSFLTRMGMQKAVSQRHSHATGHAGVGDAYRLMRTDSMVTFNKAFYSIKELTGMEESEFYSLRTPDGKEDEKRQEQLLKDGRARLGIDNDVKDKAAFTQLVNIFYEEREDKNKSDMVRFALTNAMKKKYGFKTETGVDDKVSLWMTEQLAFSWTNWTGISAYHDRRGIGWSAMAQLQMTGMYRLDKLNDKAGGGTGNPRTIFAFPQLLVPLLNGIETTGTTDVKDPITGKSVGIRRKSIAESLHDLQRLRTKQWKYREDLIKRKMATGLTEQQVLQDREFQDEDKQLNERYLLQAGELRFDEDAAAAYSNDHVKSVVESILPIIKGAVEIDLEKFTTYDPYNRDPRFDMQKFQEEVVSKLITPVRQAYSKHKDINYNMPIRVPKIVRIPGSNPPRYKSEWQTVPLARALFGYELLDCEEYRLRKNGAYQYDEEGRHLLDYNKMNKEKVYIWKRFVMMKLSGDIQQHRIRDSLQGTTKPHIYYQSVFKAIESIPGSAMGDEFKMSGLTIPTNLYAPHEMNAFKRKALATKFFGEHFALTRYYLGWLFRDLQAKEDEEGWGFGLMIGQIVKGIGFTKQSWLN